MFSRLDLRTFKCFGDLKLPLRPLTLLSGGNASGKSSVLQAMVLLHQTVFGHEWSLRLPLNADAIRLGTVADVVDQVHGKHVFGIGLFDGEESVSWDFEGDRDALACSITHVRVGSNAYEAPEALHYLLPREHENAVIARHLRDLIYLTAERLGPRVWYDFQEPGLLPRVGSKGERAVNVLHTDPDSVVIPGLTLSDAPPKLFRQVQARMACFFPGFELSISDVRQVEIVTLGLRTTDELDFHRPVHTGFGLTQVLPIIVAVLSSKEDTCLLIENPEVHLHPAGQALMGGFLAKAAAAGLQVVLETHSDHVLNGIRRAVRDSVLPPEDVALHFFRPRHEAERRGEAQVETPVLDREGGVDSWPEGFFDQFDRDMSHLAGWS